jgi:outer membrane protein assembly factor BamB
MKRIVGLLLCLCSITTVQAQNWSSFRGNNASGVAEGRKTPAAWSVDKSQNIVCYITGGYPAGRPMYAFKPGAVGDISLKPDQETNDFIAWKSSKGSPYTPTPIIYGDVLYTCADNGVLTAYDAKTGTMIYQQRLPSSFSASPVATDGKLYLSSEDGDVFVVRAGPKYELLATNVMGQPLMATPAISDGLLILRTKDFVYAIGEQ